MAKVEIYTKMTCGFCVRAKRLLEMKKVAYEEYAVDFGGAKKAEMVQRAGGRMTVPQIFINGRHVAGESGEPQRQLGQIHRERVLIDSVQAPRRDQTPGGSDRVFVRG